jgi:hypothetical protein
MVAERQIGLFGFRNPDSKLDANHASLAPHDIALPADDGVRHNREAELASDRGVDVSEKLRPICGYIQNPAFVALNVVLYRDPRRMLPGPAH